ncbi:glutamine synthetase family protein [Duganella violaceipulchra]|uniref:Glutamine synthetase n=1 Tax=Duganella violaceipulchra TaxID=2849652 RepID=A0AA41L5S8_9BURK|nr:glutamine synthetase family protein [Duganella violaceicalia]MBV6319480.1 glutamine synthetase family protein [Duganella violaceicalia]MCP2006709.1 glutamine synthetase [Duganella violaceicalia]
MNPTFSKDSLAGQPYARFLVTDIDGVSRGKHLSGEKIASMLDGGGTIASAVFGWDIQDQLYEQVSFTGFHTGFPDMGLVLDPATARQLPWDDNCWLIIGEHTRADGTPLPICPRQVLKRVLAKADALGYSAQVGAEFEWFVLDETEVSVRAKGYRDLRTATHGMTNYSPFRLGARQAFVRELFTSLNAIDVPLEALHTEAGPGNFEAAIRYGDALKTADRAVLFKESVREIGRRHGLLNTFMAKYSTDYAGCGQHLHQSLWRDGRNCFHDAQREHGMSDAMRHFIAGQLHCLPHLLPMLAPFINSYKRLVDHHLAPVKPTWAVDNRNAALRVIPGGIYSMRLETRTAGADANPYLAIAAALAAGLYGIEHKLALELQPVTGANSGAEQVERLPRTLAEATAAMERSPLARELMGEEFVDHFVQTRQWEVAQFNQSVTDWELQRYLELA